MKDTAGTVNNVDVPRRGTGRGATPSTMSPMTNQVATM